MSLLRTLLIIAVIYYSVKLIFRYVLPLIVNKAVNKAEERMRQKAEEMFAQKDSRADGEISINQNPRKQNQKRGDDGEYIDYEEIK